MRLGTIDDRLVLVDGALALDVESVSQAAFSANILDVLGSLDELRSWAANADFSRATAHDGRLGPPVPLPRQVFAIALNYRPHAAEADFQVPDAPLVFTKFPSCIAGPDTVLTLPEGNVDWEIEVVAVIGRGGREIPRERAWDHVAGLTVGQDISERVVQSSGTPAQFSLGKSFAGFGPIGPVLVTPEEFENRDDIGFDSYLDGERMQHGRTSEMIFDVPELVSRLSGVCHLWPGDLIFTGTPAGVGNRRRPPRYLRPGETLVSRAEQIGEIRQLCRAASPAAAQPAEPDAESGTSDR